MNYWLIKSEPNTYSWDDLVKLGTDMWDGVRNYAARNNLRAMELGDHALFYHSVNDKEVVGIAEVVKEHYQDPTAGEDDRWSVVDFKPLHKLPKPITLAMVKENPNLTQMELVNNTRLSVQRVKKEEFDEILKMASS